MEVLRYILITVQDFNFRLFWAYLMFMFFLPHRKKYALRLLVWLPLLVVPTVLNAFVGDDVFRVGSYTWSFLLWFAYSVFCLAFCHGGVVANMVYVAVSAYAVQNLFADLEWFMRMTWFADRSTGYVAISLGIMVILYFLIFLTYVRPWMKKMRLGLDVNKGALLALSAAMLLIINVLSSVMTNSAESSAQLADQGLLFGICTAVIIVLLSNVYDRSYLQYEREMMGRMLSEQDRQRKLSSQTIDLINIKCHDLKHQLAALKAGEGIDGDYYEKTINSISIYDSYFNTGNKSLDLVLTEKSLVCNNYKINFTCIADGKAIDFMSASDIYSFFANAIDNAVEYLKELGEDKRNLSLSVKRIKNYVLIAIENYCEAALSFEGGLPVTTKKDEAGYHGFGTRSMKYIAEELYGGNFVVRRRDNVFSVTAMLPAEPKPRS